MTLADWVIYVSAIVLFCAIDLYLMEKNNDSES